MRMWVASTAFKARASAGTPHCDADCAERAERDQGLVSRVCKVSEMLRYDAARLRLTAKAERLQGLSVSYYGSDLGVGSAQGLKSRAFHELSQNSERRT